MVRPTLTHESHRWNQGITRVIGVDEVGRGCLAGPLVIAGVIFKKTSKPIKGVADSKQLTATKRIRLARIILHQALEWKIVSIPAVAIDAIGIQTAWHMGIHQLLTAIEPVQTVLVDGIITPKLLPYSVECCPIIHGDRLVYSIACASIIAKIWRDTYMQQLSPLYPYYSWQTNMGNGTCSHLTSIKQRGVTGYHRRSFIHI